MDTYGSHEGYLFYLHTCSPAEAKRLWRESIKKEWGHRCAYCGSDIELTLDHIIPQAKGGTNHTSNVLCCCRKCNGDKGHTDWILWYIQQPFFSETQREKIEEWMGAYDESKSTVFAFAPRRNKVY